jgi:hypothetical protein
MEDRDRISAIESGGRYDLLGPITRSGDRAYGRYQVMGNNVGPWTAQVFGKPMTPDEFLANPQAQDAVFDHVFGGYKTKYGPGGAARAWFAGEGGMNDPNRKDILGTTVANYERKFLGGTGPIPPQNVASTASPSSVGELFADYGAIPLNLLAKKPRAGQPVVPPQEVDIALLDPALAPRAPQVIRRG